MRLTRRLLLIAAPLAAAGVAQAGEAPDRFVHLGHVVDLSAVPADQRPALAAWIRQQIGLVQGLSIRDDVKAWFASVPVTVDPALNQPGRFAGGRLTLDDQTSPPDNPVLLHELLHAYMDARLPRTGQLRRFYDQARASGDWPADAYMLRNPAEFFAMTGSVALWGRAARAPFTRERLRASLPDCHDWLAGEFGLRA
ncbi:hypothetical protein [Brevundimonas sp.]|uniref:hypothetical protein n=1 Tax=Brevundimonas sp. TaxID=1871086 RepID=UPI002EDB4119